MRRGDIVTVATKGPWLGKPRPAVVVQTDAINQMHPTITICPLTSAVRPWPRFRLDVSPSDTNMLQRDCQLMVDKVAPAPRSALRPTGGRLAPWLMLQLDRSLRWWLEL